MFHCSHCGREMNHSASSCDKCQRKKEHFLREQEKERQRHTNINNRRIHSAALKRKRVRSILNDLH